MRAFDRSCVVVVLLSALHGAASAAERAVEAVHVQGGIHSVDSETSGSTSIGSIGADLAATLPLGNWFGATLGGAYTRSRVHTRDVAQDQGVELTGASPVCNFD